MERVTWPRFDGRRVLLGVSGGIAAYKAAELCRLLARQGAEVTVAMTESARRFVGEVTFEALTGRPVHLDLCAPRGVGTIGHIELADGAELFLLAPATADRLARLAHGIADDLVSAVYLAFRGPVLLAPAMNVHMWEHPATRENARILHERGHAFVGPDVGEMACGHVGAGRMAEPETILQAAGAALSRKDLAGRRLLVTAGPTHEPIDPVRFVGNRSSGKMGFALAAEAARRGAATLLVAGPCSLATPYAVERIDVRTAAEMQEAVAGRAGGVDAVLMAAAVADYRPRANADGKLKKEAVGERLSLDLVRTEDILAGLGVLADRPFLVGFAAETGGLDDLPGKLRRKGCDLLVGNDVSQRDAGFEVDTNRVTLLSEGGPETIPLADKREVAARILDRVAAALLARSIRPR